ncbi:hypothetical protein MMC27_005637 [Xylographa pallens]|nr:hypothetical protein [Xylographa pallens]
MASTMSLPAALSPSLTSREAIADALYRFVIGMDTNDIALFDSAFTQDARWEFNGRVVEGLKAVHTDCYEATISKLDTTHFVTNIRIDVIDGGSKASMSALYLAHHYRGGTGRVPGATRYIMGGMYFANLVKDDMDGLWRINIFKMKGIWSEGDRSVMGHE